jgi:hypothetical protein
MTTIKTEAWRLFYKTEAWRKLREEALASCPVCERSEKPGGTEQK